MYEIAEKQVLSISIYSDMEFVDMKGQLAVFMIYTGTAHYLI